MKRSTFSIFIVTGLFLLFGCTNLTDKTEPKVNDGKAYLTFATLHIGTSSRTALPEFTDINLEDFTFTLTGTEDASKTQGLLGVFEGLSGLSNASITCTEGTWSFTLRAQKDGTVFTGSINNKKITVGKNELSFTLTWDKTSLSGKGNLNFTLNYSQAENADKVALVTAELFSYDVTTGEETALETFPETELTRENNSVTFKADSLASGNYRIKIHLYADSEKKNLINTWRELAVITDGKTSTASRTMGSLNEVYSITYNADDGTFENSQTVAGSFTKNTETFELPSLTKTGYTFEGWYADGNFTGDAVTQIEKGSTGNKTFHAKFTLETYTVSFVTDEKYASGTTENQAFTYGIEQTLSASRFIPAEGYEFKEWNSKADGSGTSYNLQTQYTFTEDTTLYAIWSPLEYTINYVLNASDNDPILLTYESQTTFTVEDLPLTLKDPVHYGYEFVGWYSDSECSGEKTTTINAVPTDSITLYAKWNLPLHESIVELPEGTKGTGDVVENDPSSVTITKGITWRYVYFGDWPQTVKDNSVTVDENISEDHGAFTYYKGSDGAWYVKGPDDKTYFKVEPIKWRVLTEDYNGTGKTLLLAERILTSNIPYYGTDSETRTLNEETIHPNNYKYSNVRAYLNGTKNQFVEDGGTASNDDTDWTNKGFLQTAFTQDAQNLIATTSVDNSAESTNPTKEDPDKENEWNNGENAYACADTKDKIFLLSQREVTMDDYGFEDYFKWPWGGNSWGLEDGESTRIHYPTDFANANNSGEVGWWWIRSPYHTIGDDSITRGRYVDNTGNGNVWIECSKLNGGIVPALCISSGSD